MGLFKQVCGCTPDSGIVADEHNLDTTESLKEKIWQNYKEKKFTSFTTAQVAVQVRSITFQFKFTYTSYLM